MWMALQPEAPDARTSADAVDPRLDRRQRGLQLDPESAEHHDARRERCIGEAELLPDQVLVPGELVAKVVEGSTKLLARLLDALLIALRIRPAELGQQHRGGRDERVVAVVLEHPHPGPPLRVLGHQTGERILVFQILVDDRGIVDNLVPIDPDPDFAIRVQAQEFRELLLLLAQIDEDLLVLEVLLREHDTDLLAERTIGIIVQLQHLSRPLLPPPPPTSTRTTASRNDGNANGKGRPWQYLSRSKVATFRSF